ncbi:hypothetical protein CPB85DRAFT_1348749 [Mucidula mucida]|nr:hypothetical protein CPB85DRAFT_1348749 [Mucidula mucida]
MLLAGPREEEASPSPPKPRPMCIGYQGFFKKEVALERARLDTQYIQLIMSCRSIGLFQVNPQSHPLYRSTLSPYMARYGRPLGMNCALQHLQFFDSNFGQFFSNFDSEIGVPPAAFLMAMHASVICDFCLCVFSPPGFLAHAPDGECKNWISHNRVDRMLLVRSERDLNLSVPLRAIRPSDTEDKGVEGDGYEAPTLEETAIRVAFIEWNSRVGVTQNVWALLSTSDIYCEGCSLICTWYGHIAHFKKDDTCSLALGTHIQA